MTAVNLADGQVLRAHHAGAPVVGVGQTADGGLLIATRTGVQALDAAWQPRGALARSLRRALPTGDRGLLVTRDDHTLELLELSS